MKEKQNARNSNRKSSSRFAAAVTAKRTARKSDSSNVVGNGKQDNGENVRATIYTPITTSGTSRNEIESGNAGGGNGRDGDVRGRTGTGSGRDTDNRTGTGTTVRTANSSSGDARTELDQETTLPLNEPIKKTRKKRITIAERAEQLAAEMGIDAEEAEQQIRAEKASRKPRKVTSLDGEVEPGVTASVMLLSAGIEGLSELIVLATNKPYLKLERAEARDVSEAWMQILDSWPKSVRKNFDRMFAKYYPYWNMTKALTAVAYPRWQMYKMEKEFIKNAQATQAQAS